MDKLRISQQHQELGADESGHISTATLDASMSLLTLRASPPHAAATSTTGLVYDPRCLLHQANHHHVEQPARASTTMTLLQSSGLYARCVLVPTRTATDAELIGMVHTKEHVATIDATVHYEYKPAELDSETEGDTTLYPDCKFLDSDTYVNQYSSAAARLSIGGLINLMDEVVAGRLQNGFAVIRPPGHHADCVKAQGFCLYNNVAVAVQNMRLRHPDLIKRVLIIDWDVHHGNVRGKNIFSYCGDARSCVRGAPVQLLTDSRPPLLVCCSCAVSVCPGHPKHLLQESLRSLLLHPPLPERLLLPPHGRSHRSRRRSRPRSQHQRPPKLQGAW